MPKKGGKLKAKEVKDFLNASYDKTPPNDLDGYILDKSLSTATAKVYYNPQTNHAVVAHRGTKGALDWGNNLAYALGAYEYTNRYKQGKSVQDKAEAKYGKSNISTLGHSQGAILARKLGTDTKEVINVNPAYTGERPAKNEYNIRSSTDVVSGLYAPVAKTREMLFPTYSEKHDITIPSQSATDVLGEHSYDILDRLGEKEIGVGAGNKMLSNSIMKAGKRYSRLGYSGEDIDWIGGGVIHTNNNCGAVGTPYVNKGTNPYGTRGAGFHDGKSSLDKYFKAPKGLRRGGALDRNEYRRLRKLARSLDRRISKMEISNETEWNGINVAEQLNNINNLLETLDSLGEDSDDDEEDLQEQEEELTTNILNAINEANQMLDGVESSITDIDTADENTSSEQEEESSSDEEQEGGAVDRQSAPKQPSPTIAPPPLTPLTEMMTHLNILRHQQLPSSIHNLINLIDEELETGYIEDAFSIYNDVLERLRMTGGKIKKVSLKSFQKGMTKMGTAFGKAGEALNPMSYAVKDKGTRDAMVESGVVTQDYALPAVVSAGKPIYDATAITASTMLTGNPVLGKAVADTLWNEMVAKKGYDPRENQKSAELGELSSTFGQAVSKPYSVALSGRGREHRFRLKAGANPQVRERAEEITPILDNHFVNLQNRIREQIDFGLYDDAQVNGANSLRAHYHDLLGRFTNADTIPEQDSLIEQMDNASRGLTNYINQAVERYAMWRDDDRSQDIRNARHRMRGMINRGEPVRAEQFVPPKTKPKRGGRRRNREEFLNEVRQELIERYQPIQSRMIQLLNRGNLNEDHTFNLGEYLNTDIMGRITEINDDRDVEFIESELNEMEQYLSGINTGGTRMKGGKRRTKQELLELVPKLRQTAQKLMSSPQVDDEDKSFLQDFILQKAGVIRNELEGNPNRQRLDGIEDELLELRHVISDALHDIYPEEPLTDEESGSDEEEEEVEGAGRKKKIDFEKIKWGSFTRMFKEFKKENPKARVKDLEAFAKRIMKNKKKFSDKAIKKAQFYLNIINK